MRWDRDHRSDFVEDRRGQSPRGGGGMGGSGLFNILAWVFRKFGVVGVVVVLVGYGALRYFGGGGSSPVASDAATTPGAGDDQQFTFVSFVLDDVQSTWMQKYKDAGQTYKMSTLVVFTNRTDTACGMGESATGPFYCPRDQKVYIDLGFFQTLQDRLGAKGDFARAYVIAHEIGHHISNLENVLGKGRDKGADSGSVRIELQADCYAGVWAHAANERKLVEMGDIQEAMTAAKAIGDDALQGQGGGVVRPETFTHGTSRQRAKWFNIGYQSGNPKACDTFSATNL